MGASSGGSAETNATVGRRDSRLRGAGEASAGQRRLSASKRRTALIVNLRCQSARCQPGGRCWLIHRCPCVACWVRTAAAADSSAAVPLRGCSALETRRPCADGSAAALRPSSGPLGLRARAVERVNARKAHPLLRPLAPQRPSAAASWPMRLIRKVGLGWQRAWMRDALITRQAHCNAPPTLRNGALYVSLVALKAGSGLRAVRVRATRSASRR